MPSTVIHHYHYNSANHQLRIHYQSGVAYDYKGVPEELYENFRSAISKGKFLNKEIKGKYPFERVNE
jgi:hypothetical protein